MTNSKLITLKERTLPAFLPQLLRPGFDSSPYLVNFNQTFEISLDTLELVEPFFASELEAYWLKSRHFFDDIARGVEPKDYITTLRLLESRSQSTTKGSKADLIDELNALEEVELIRENLQLILGDNKPELQPTSFMTIDNINEEVTTYTFTLSGQNNYSHILGGLPSRAEIARVFKIKTSRAKWRDRRVRRLVSLEVYAKEIWPKK